MHPEIQKLLNQVNGTPVRVSSTRFACLWDPPLDFRRAVVYMRNLLTCPPAGFVVEEVEGRKVTLEIRRLHQ
jgi:hypothetical protein